MLQVDPLPNDNPELAPAPPQPRHIGRVNWLGLWTLYVKEVRRFTSVFTQTIIAPVVVTLVFLAIFSLALGRAVEQLGGVPFLQFLAPGLIIMAMIQNSFANTSSSMLIAKVQGNIVDVLMPPLNSTELILAYVLAGLTRGMVVGASVGIAMSFVVPLHFHNLGLVAFHAVAASLMLSLIGLMAGIWADKFDHIASITNFIITPLSFLSGTFYSIERLPGFWREMVEFNPFFLLIDGFRYGVIGHADGSIATGVIALTTINVVLWALCHRMFATGYKLKT